MLIFANFNHLYKLFYRKFWQFLTINLKFEGTNFQQ